MKRIIVMILMLFSTIGASAQDGVTVSIKGGLNWAGLKGSAVDSFSNGGAAGSHSGMLIGITLDNRIASHFWLKHEVFYSRRIMSIKLDDGSHPVFNSNFKRQYIDIFPLSPTFHYHGFQVYAGPYLGVLLTASVQRMDANGSLYTDKSFFGDSGSSGSYSHKFDAGITGGIEYELPFGIHFGARFVRGFVPLIENSAIQKQWHIYNQGFELTIGYRLNL